MALLIGAQGRLGRGARQAGPGAVLVRVALARAVLAVVAAGLGGCDVGARAERLYSSKLPFDTPIEWWHDLQGGLIAEERPPPPGVGDPYPNLSEIPAKPKPTDAVTRRALADRLGTERDRAGRAAAQDPIATLTPAAPAAARPVAAKAGEATPPPMASLEAADAPAPPAASSMKAGMKAGAAVPSVPDAAPAPPSFAAAAAPVAAPRRADPEARFVEGPVPALPGEAPAVPVLPGVPASTFAAPVPRAAPQVAAAFLPGSAVMRPESDAALRDLAVRRGGGDVALLGGGDAASADAGVQAAALPLAWRRARAMADVLVAAGVPVSAMRIDAAALGRGGVARLLN